MDIREYIYNEDEIRALYDDAGWKAYTYDMPRLKRAYDASLKVLAAYEDGSLAVAMFNLTKEPKKIGFVPHSLGLMETQTVRDLWRQKDLGTVERKDRWETEVAPHGVVFVRLSPGLTDTKYVGFWH